MIDIRNVTKVFGEGDTKVVALNDISLTIDAGDFVAIMGPSGSGKSTLLNIIGGLDDLTHGEVVMDGKRIDSLDENALVDIRRGKISYVFQQYHLIPYLTVIENIMITGLAQKEKIQELAVFELLKNLGLKNRYNHNPDELSAGEKQRTALARAVIYEPNLILADEITGNLDMNNTERILQFLRNYTETGKTVILATHNKDASKYADRTINLN